MASGSDAAGVTVNHFAWLLNFVLLSSVFAVFELWMLKIAVMAWSSAQPALAFAVGGAPCFWDIDSSECGTMR